MKPRAARGPRWATLVTLIASLSVERAAHAQVPGASSPGAPSTGAGAPAAAEEEAIRRYGDGRRLLEAGDYTKALIELRASLAALPSPNTELLVGHAQRLGGARGEAAATYRRVILTAGEKIRAGEDRFQATLEEAGRWEATLRAELAEVEIFVAGAPAGTIVAVDGTDVESTAQPRGVVARVLHEPGPVAVTARSPEGRTVSGSAQGTAGARVAIDLDLAPKVAETRDSSSGEGLGPPPLPSWIAAGVGATGLVVFGVFGAMSASTASDLDACAPSCSASLREDADGGARDQTIANVGLVIGAVGLVTAGVLWVAWPAEPSASAAPDPAAPSSSPAGSPAGPSASLRLRVGPGASDVTLRF